jgi:dephospho-CoA kinase
VTGVPGFVVALTGGIGSGKSAAADEFARLGATVVDTDVIAHELTGQGGAAVSRIEELFGKNFISSGAMDRKRMREHVFGNPAEKKKLEALLHPLIRAEGRRRIEAATGPYVVYVVPLLVESGDPRRGVDRVLVVDAPEQAQLERVRQRSGLAEAEVRAILAAQATRAARRAAADDVLDNAGSLESLRKQVAALHQKYLQSPRR